MSIYSYSLLDLFNKIGVISIWCWDLKAIKGLLPWPANDSKKPNWLVLCFLLLSQSSTLFLLLFLLFDFSKGVTVL